jgi:TolA-binding protein
MSLNHRPHRSALRHWREQLKTERISSPPLDIAGAADTPDDLRSVGDHRPPSLSAIAAQLRAIAPDLEMLKHHNYRVTELANQLQSFERRIRSLESTRLDFIRQERVQQRSQSKSIFNRNR